MTFPNARPSYISGGLICLILLGVAFFLEVSLKLQPCSLCLLQRYVILIMAFIFFLGALIPGNRRCPFYLVSIIQMSVAVLGILLAGRQVWLQQFPVGTAPPCTASLSRLLEFYPMLDVLKMTLSAAQDCAKETFTLLGLSLASWTLLAFIFLFFFGLMMIFQIKKGRI